MRPIYLAAGYSSRAFQLALAGLAVGAAISFTGCASEKLYKIGADCPIDGKPTISVSVEIKG